MTRQSWRWPGHESLMAMGMEVSVLPPGLAARPVPLIVMYKEPPHTTLFHALLTNEPENVF